MRYIRYAFLAVLAVGLILVALANRGLVTLQILPEEIANLIGFSAQIELPLFIVILLGIMVGLLVGFTWEWLREHKHRAAASGGKREVAALEREVSRLRKEKAETSGDDVLALLENGSATR
ncbi:lipopolysaccharide assembly protein LapA domain-containing protein [Cochlodiniinecator piscidefendens]|uniref:lipopolysaccharide assembly protein LapA domain-containing protein n=1 Tax=Cochlodiniinecator piscidefendens TaxID=2715756 RepID=UPI001407774E|nr:LapA family protein [Cochlodiniinecator piscidefendens]